MEKDKNVKYGLLGVAALFGILGFALFTKGWGLLLLATALGAACTAIGMFLGEAPKAQLRGDVASPRENRTHATSPFDSPLPKETAPSRPSLAPKPSARAKPHQQTEHHAVHKAKAIAAKTGVRPDRLKRARSPLTSKKSPPQTASEQRAVQAQGSTKPQPKKHRAKRSAVVNLKKATPVQNRSNLDPSTKTPSTPKKALAEPRTQRIAQPKSPINSSTKSSSSKTTVAKTPVIHKPIPAPHRPHTRTTESNNTPQKIVITQLGSYSKLFEANRKNSEKSAFAHFYFKGSEGETFETPFQQLADMANAETWNYERPEFQRPNQTLPILRRYLNYTFLRLQSQRKIEIATVTGEVRACFNTGLQTSAGGKDIFAVFSKNDKASQDNDFPEWWFRGWHDSYSTMLSGFRPLPTVATYVSDNRDLVFETSYDIDINFEHIIEDPKNRDRLPKSLRSDRTLAINAVRGAAAYLKQKHRNNRMMAIPFWYPEHEKIQFLLPLRLTSADHEVLALVADKQERDKLYKIRTALTMDMAYSNARLVGKPNREWLNP